MKTITRNGHTFTFDEDLALRWIEALESGTYKQGRIQLRTKSDEFCCLGVECHIAIPDKWRLRDDFWIIEEPDASDGKFAIGSLPKSQQVALGLMGGLARRADNEQWNRLGGWLDLAGANDFGASFLDIAAALRDYYGFPPRESAVSS